jgi:tetratricopeptide (TPR) repeat protein
MSIRQSTAAALGATLFTALLALAIGRRAETTVTPVDRFDYSVRTDFFAGFRGDTVRLARGMKLCEDALAANADHADALVWHGAGLMFLAGEAAARQDRDTARERASRAREELDRAAALAPDSLNVIIVRAVVLNAAAPRVSDRTQSEAMQKAAVEGFEKALAIQTPYLDRLSEHARGELLGGLAEGWSRLGEADKARAFLQRIANELPDSRYAARAKAWLEDGPQAGPMTCLTCHRQ